MSQKVEKLEIKNFKGIENASYELNGSSVFAIGGNGQGKTSFIDAVWTALTGKNLPPKPIKQGEDKAETTIELTDYKVTAKYKEGKSTPDIILSTRDGNAKFQSPRTMLNDLIGIIDFDPNYFFSLQPKPRREYIFKLAGLDFSETDQKIKTAEEERTIKNRELKQTPEADYDAELAEKEPVSFSELSQKFQDAQEWNQRIDKAEEEKSNIENNIVEIQSEIDQLEEKLKKLRSEKEQQQERKAKANRWLEENERVDTSKIQEEINNSEETNRQIQEAKEAKKQNEKREIIKQDVDNFNEQIKELTDHKIKAVKEAIQVPGLEFDGENFTIDGLPFEKNQVNTAQQIISGMKLGLNLIKDVRIMRLDASLIDDENLEEVKKWASNNEIQLFVEMLDRSANEIQIVIDQQE